MAAGGRAETVRSYGSVRLGDYVTVPPFSLFEAMNQGESGRHRDDETDERHNS